MHFTNRLSQTALLSLLSLLPSTLADPAPTKDSSPKNYFINPGPTGQDNFIPGEIIHVAFETNFTDPYLTLFCGGLEKPRVAVHVQAPGYDLPGELATATPNCYFQLQQGEGPANAHPSIGTGIFAIGNGTEDGRVLNSTQEDCCACSGGKAKLF